MRDTNQAVFYTTAQVTEMVELSDQNVRKYVRLLEERKYNVAKDEHNRRLFSGNDIVVIKELITKAKQPGYTLETAADEIIDQVNDILSSSDTTLPSTVNNSDISEMFSKVMDKLEVIQEENRDLKSNINNLVERLEAYDEYEKHSYLSYSGEESHEENDNTHKTTENNASYVSAEDEAEQDEANPDEEEVEAEYQSDNHSVDMDQYNNSGEAQKEDEEEKRPEKKGFFSGLMDLFKA